MHLIWDGREDRVLGGSDRPEWIVDHCMLQCNKPGGASDDRTGTLSEGDEVRRRARRKKRTTSSGK